MDYNGWNLIDDVIIVCRPKQKKTDWSEAEDFYQGYIVDAKNKKQVETARSWASVSYYNKAQEQLEFKYKNEGFKLQLYDSAAGSCQGGKLSFWNCLLMKNDKTFKIGINADLLIDVLKNSTVVNGIIQENVLFATQSGKVGVLHKGMPQYQEALKDMEKKSDIKTKTSKHIIGHNYYTLTENHIYLGDLYDWFEPVMSKVRNSYWYSDREEIIGYRIANKPKHLKMFHSIDDDDKNIKSIKEFCKNKIELYSNDITKYVYHIGLDERKDKLPSRTEGNIVWKNDMSIDNWNKFILDARKLQIEHNTHERDYQTKEIKECPISLWCVKEFGISVYADKPPEFTDEEIKMFGNYYIN